MKRLTALILALAMMISVFMPNLSAAYMETMAEDASSIAEEAADASSLRDSQSEAEEDRSASNPEAEAEQSASDPEASASGEPEGGESSDEQKPQGQKAKKAETSRKQKTPKQGIYGKDFDPKRQAPELKQLKKTLKTVDGVTYRLTVSYDKNAGIPDDAKLSVVELNQALTEEELEKKENKKRPCDTERFVSEKALEQDTFDLQLGLKVRKKDYVLFTKFLDLSLTADGKEVQPKAPVTVTLETDVVEEGASDALEAAVLDETATEQWQKEREKLVKKQEKQLKSGKLKEKDVQRFPERVFRSLKVTNETKKKKGTRVSFRLKEFTRLGVAGVAKRLKSWKVKGETVCVYGPRGLKAKVRKETLKTPKAGMEKVRAFSVKPNEKKNPGYDVTFWVGGVPEQYKTTQDDAAQDNAAQDDAAKDNAAQDDAAQDDAAQDNAAQDDAAQDDAAQDNAAQDNAAQDDAAQDNAAQDDTAKDDAALSTMSDEEPDTGVVVSELKRGGRTGRTLIGIGGSSAPVAIQSGKSVGLLWDTGLRAQSVEAEQVSVEGLLPKNAQVSAEDMLWRYSRPEEVVEDVGEEAETLAAYDITISGRQGEFQPDKGESVSVSIRDESISSRKKLEVWHLKDDGSVKVIRDFTVKGDTLSFEAEGFSVYMVVQVSKEQTVTAGDGKAYQITVTYDADAGIPEDAELQVSELDAKGKDYQKYVKKAAKKLETKEKNFAFAHAFDIALVNPETGEHCQPTKPLSVSMKLLSEDVNEKSDLDVVHFGDETEVLESSVKGESVEFETNGFSVYVVIKHEGEGVETPRVEFHFIGDQFEGDSPYQAHLYQFLNTAGDMQTSQLIHNKDTLESIKNPDNKDDTDEYFFGWYEVEYLGPGDDGKIRYQWTNEPQPVEFNRPITVSGATEGDNYKVTWSIGNYSETLTTDEDGCAHVYLAPLYQRHCFVNFHMASLDSGPNYESLRNTVMVRRVLVFGRDDTAKVRIGDIQASPINSDIQIFTGWEQVASGTNIPYNTVDRNLKEKKFPEGEDGYYLTVTKNKDEEGVSSIDLYPRFTSARWIKFHTGETSNGAIYVGDVYLITKNDIYDDNKTILPVSQRLGYRFDGWYTAEDADHNGTGRQITDAEGNIVKQEITGTGYEVTTEGKLYLDDELPDTGLNLYAKWEPADNTNYQVIIWKQKVTDSVNTTHTPVELAQWLAQPGNSTKTEADYVSLNGPVKKYDYETVYTGTTSSKTTITNDTFSSFSGKNAAGNNVSLNLLTTGGQGFKNAYTDCAIKTLQPDGTTVYNVYYDRETITMNFKVYGRGFNYSEATDDTEPQYGLINGQYLQLKREVASSNYSYSNYTYTKSNLNSNGYYYIVENGAYSSNQVRLYRYNNRWYRTRTGLVNYSYSNEYTGDVYTRSNSTSPYNGTTRYKRDGVAFTPTEEDGDNLYGKDTNGIYMPLSVSIVDTYQWTFNDEEYTGTRYKKTENNSGNREWRDYLTFTGLYGQTLRQAGYVWHTEYDWYENGYGTGGNKQGGNAGTTGGTRTTFLDAFLPSSGDTTLTFYGSAPSGSKTIHFYKQKLNQDGSLSNPDDVSTSYYEANTVKSSGTGFNLTNKYNGYQVYKWKNGNGALNSVGEQMEQSDGSLYYDADPNTYGYQSASFTSELHIYFKLIPHQLSFEFNYPKETGVTFNGGAAPDKERLLVEPLLGYEQPLSAYGGSSYDKNTNLVSFGENRDLTMLAPDHYTFMGWYTDSVWKFNKKTDTGHSFDFDSETMPSAPLALYAKWQAEKFPVTIDPNGGIIDHVDYTSAQAATSGFKAAVNGSGHGTASTYFNCDWHEKITFYEEGQGIKTPSYVPISKKDAEVRIANNEEVYYYFNTKKDPDRDLDAELRNAMYLTEAQIEAYVNYYNLVYTGSTPLDVDTWKALYLEKNETEGGYQAYRHTYGGDELYRFLGWYEVIGTNPDGTPILDTMPYDFGTQVDHPTTLQAQWRLEGKYKVVYTPNYYVEETDQVVNGKMSYWQDPVLSHIFYSDGARTAIYKQPTELKIGDVPTNDYVFIGWRLVTRTRTGGTDENPTYEYSAIEPGKYYQPGEAFVVHARYADAQSLVHLQAVYQPKATSILRPEIANLILDANATQGGYISTDNGENHASDTDLPPRFHSGVGTAAARAIGQIAFRTLQTNASIKLSEYEQYFHNENGYHLLGFDKNANEDDFIADYCADAVVGLDRATVYNTLHAVWEPLVYVELVNKTGIKKDVHVAIDGDVNALYIVNKAKGSYEREPQDRSDIKVPMGTVDEPQTVRLAVPYGANANLTFRFKNELGQGYFLCWNSKVNENGQVQDGRVDNTQFGSFNETLTENANGESIIRVTFTSLPCDYVLLLDDGYEGGSVQEKDFSKNKVLTNETPVGAKITELPKTGTRLTYKFKGWAAQPNATEPLYSATNNWTIPNLEEFFADAATVGSMKVKTLYAVWDKSNESQIVKVYNDVPVPGNREEEIFEYTVRITAKFTKNTYNESINEYKTFHLAHNEYLWIKSSNSPGTSTKKPFLKSEIQIYRVGADGADDEPVGEVETILWEYNSTGAGGGFNGTERITVTETVHPYYDTTVYAASVYDTGKPLYYNNNNNNQTLPNSLQAAAATREIYWKDTDAGGSVVFTNVVKRADVTLKKALIDTESGTFPFQAVYSMPGNDPFTPSSFNIVGAGSHKLENLPLGSVVTITEIPNADFITTASGAEGGSFVEATGAYSFTLTGEQSVTFTNRMKTYPVTFKSQDQNGDFVSGIFALYSSVTGGYLSQTLIPERDSTIFYPTKTMGGTSVNLPVGEYRLTQSYVTNGYQKLNGEVFIRLKNDGTIEMSPSDLVDVACTGNSNDGFVITVTNRESKTITIQKQLLDVLAVSTARRFRFTASYTLPGGAPVSVEVPTMPLVRNGEIQSVSITAPAGANLTVSELTDQQEYDTSVKIGDQNVTDPDNPITKTFPVSNDATVTFVNSRKTVKVTIQKIVSPPELGGEYEFTAKLTNNSGVGIPYTLNETDGITTTGEDGITAQPFKLSHEQSVELNVPSGATLSVSEIVPSGMKVEIVSESDEPDAVTTDADTYTLAKLTKDDTLIFTNSIAGYEIKFKKTDGCGQALQGATFQLFTDDGCTTAYETSDHTTITGTSDSNGVVQLSDKVPDGVYYMKETEAPSGYAASSNIYILLVGEEMLTVPDQTTGSLWASDKVLANINQNDIDSQTNKYDDLYSDNDNLYDQYAIFLIKDVSTDPNSTSMKADSTPDIADKGILNDSLNQPWVILDKIDGSDRNPLPGATFELLRHDLSKVGNTYESGAGGGAFYVGSLPVGIYYVHETDAPTGYQENINIADGTNEGWWWRLTVNPDGTVAFSDKEATRAALDPQP